MSELCPCCSQTNYQDCCQPYLDGSKKAPTALALMRSRYSAYVTGHIDYIEQTMRKKALVGFNKQEVLAWAKQCEWQKLEVVNASKDTVHFIATFKHNGIKQQLIENSLFERSNGQWFYVGEATNQKTPRNAPCLCGSGKKYKRCCAK